MKTDSNPARYGKSFQRVPALALAALLGLSTAAWFGCESSPDYTWKVPDTEDGPDAAITPPVTPNTAGPLSSVSRIAFGASDVLFVADWKAAKIYAFTLPKAAKDDGAFFNIKNFESTLSKSLGGVEIALEDVVARPGSNEVYASVSVGDSRTPAIVMAKADGSVQVVDLDELPQTSAALDKAPDEKLMFWRTIPGRSFTVTDMKWYDGKLYVTGLSNQAFSSTLRVLGYPFGAGNTMASVEMYHTAHAQAETRAPIRAFEVVTLGGKPHLLAAYLCTPLVTIPNDQITDGAHVVAKTIAEMGYAGIPTNIVKYSAKDQMGNSTDYVLMQNLHRQAWVVPLADVEAANLAPGLSTPQPGNTLTGVANAYGAEMSPVFRIVNQNDNHFIVLRRDLRTGQSELVSYLKSALFRLSDFEVSEFLFNDYTYDAQHEGVKQFQNALKKLEGYPDLVR